MKNYFRKIPLGDGKFAYEQTPEARKEGENLVKQVFKRWDAPSFFFHMKAGGHVAALASHKKNCYFTKLDISRFYYNVTRAKLVRSLQKIGVPFEAAMYYAQISLVCDRGHRFLPYGFHQSPALSALVLDKSLAGRYLREAARKFTLSVYVDDIILSSRNSEALAKSSDQLVQALHGSNFSINESKSKICSASCISFNVLIQENSTEITDQRLDQFKTQISEVNGKESVVQGILQYVHSISPEQAKDLAREV